MSILITVKTRSRRIVGQGRITVRVLVRPVDVQQARLASGDRVGDVVGRLGVAARGELDVDGVVLRLARGGDGCRVVADDCGQQPGARTRQCQRREDGGEAGAKRHGEAPRWGDEGASPLPTMSLIVRHRPVKAAKRVHPLT
jgi:hypothetical protein